MSGAVPAIPRRTFPNANGGVLARGLVYTYIAGTSTLATTWQDIAMSIPNTNPILLDTTGSCTLWTDPSLNYKFQVYNAGNALQYTLDNVLGSGQSPTLQQSHVDTFSGNGVNKIFTLSAAPASINDTNVYVAGVYQDKALYNLSGNTITFVAAPGITNVEVTYYVLLDFTGLAATIAGYSAAASASASDAQTSALAASTSETNAAGSVTAINNRIYPGTYTVAPTTRPDGSARQSGDEYFDATANKRYTYNGATWVASDINTANLAASSGSSLVGFLQAGTGAVATDAQSKMRETVSVTDFAANGVSGAKVDPTGVTESSAGILAALNTGKSVRVPAGTYKLAPSAALAVNNNGLQTLYADGPVTFSVTLPGSNILFSFAGPTAVQGITFDFNAGYCMSALTYANGVGNVVLRHLVVQNITDTNSLTSSQAVAIPPNGNTFDIEDIAFINCKKKGNGVIGDGGGNWTGIYIGGGTGGPTQGRICNIRFNNIHNIDAVGNVIYEDTSGVYVITAPGDTQNCIEVSDIFGLEFGKRLVKIQASNTTVRRVVGYSTTGDSASVVGMLNGTPGTDDKFGCSATDLRAYGLMEAAFAASAPGMKWKNLNAFTTPGNKSGMAASSFGLVVLGDDQELDGFNCGSTYLIGIGISTQIIKNTKLKNLRLTLNSAVASCITTTNGELGFDGLTIDGVRAVADSTWPGTVAIIDTSNYLNGTTVIGHNVIVRDVHIETAGPAASYGLNFKYITNISLTGYRYINTSGLTHFQLAIFENCVNVNVDDVMIEGANTIGVFVKNCTGRATINRVVNPSATTAAVYTNGSTNVIFNDCDPTKVGGSTAFTVSPAPSTVTTVAAATYTVAGGDGSVINNYATGTCTLTLPSASLWSGRTIYIRSLQAQTTVSNAANVVPLAGGAAATAILAATAGKWAQLVSDGTNWQIQAAN